MDYDFPVSGTPRPPQAAGGPCGVYGKDRPLRGRGPLDTQQVGEWGCGPSTRYGVPKGIYTFYRSRIDSVLSLCEPVFAWFASPTRGRVSVYGEAMKTTIYKNATKPRRQREAKMKPFHKIDLVASQFSR